MVLSRNIDIERPRYDQNTYIGRAKHFIITTNPLNILATNKQLEEAKNVVEAYRRKERMPESMTEDELWKAKQLYDSAFHPDTGEKITLIGRMSAQVPMNTLLVTGMIATYQNYKAVIFWQWLNQSFNALVNYSNRSGDSVITKTQLFTAYVCATTGALGTALGLKKALVNCPSIVKRFVPFGAIAAAHCVNIPLMRYRELQEGTPIYTSPSLDGDKIGYSTNAAIRGIAQVIFSRISMSVPSMGLTPVVIHYLEEKGLMQKYPWINIPTQTSIVAVSWVVATPLCCALFKQWSDIEVSKLEDDLQETLIKKYGYQTTDVVVYNKGL